MVNDLVDGIKSHVGRARGRGRRKGHAMDSGSGRMGRTASEGGADMGEKMDEDGGVVLRCHGPLPPIRHVEHPLARAYEEERGDEVIRSVEDSRARRVREAVVRCDSHLPCDTTPSS